MRNIKIAFFVFMVGLLISFSSGTNCWATGYDLAAKWGGYVTNRIEYPTAIETDSNNNIYVIDDWYHKLTKIDSTGNVAWEKYFKDADDNCYTIYDLSISADGNTIYLLASLIADRIVIKYDVNADAFSILDIQGSFIATDSNDNIYVTDDTLVKKYSPLGNLLISWGTGDAFSDLGEIKVDSSDNIYVLDYANFDLKKFDTAGKLLKQIGGYGYTDGKFYWLHDLATDSQNNIYVLNWRLMDYGFKDMYKNGEHEIQKFSSDGTFISTVTLPDYLAPKNIAFDSSGNMFITSADFYGYVAKYGVNMNLISVFMGEMEDGKFAYPKDIALIPPNRTGVLGIRSSQQDDHNGYTFYVADTDNHRIQKLNVNGSTIDYLSKWGTFGTGNGQFIYPSDIACDYNYVYVVDRGNNRIQKFDHNGNFITKWGSKGSGNGLFKNPGGITIIEESIYIADTDNYRIQKFDSSGNFITAWETKDTDGQFLSPTGIATDSSGNVYVAEATKIQKFDKDGKFISFLIADLSLNQIFKIAVDKDNNIYITDNSANRIIKLDNDGKIITTIEKSDSYGDTFSPQCIAIGPYLDIYLISVSKIWSFTPSFYYIKGQIMDTNGAGLTDVTINLSNSKTLTAITDATGNYQFSDLAIGNYKITPNKKGYFFDKENISITPLNSNLENQNISEISYPTNPGDTTISIRGSVKDVYGLGIENTIVNLSVSKVNLTVNTVTNNQGGYEFIVPVIHDPGVYTLAVNKTAYSFTPSLVALSNVKSNMDNGTNIENQDFNGTPLIANTNEFKIMGGENGYINTAKGEKAQFIINHDNSGLIEIKVYDLTGALVWETSKEVTANNVEIITWDGRNSDDKRVSSGIYIAHINGVGINQTKKVAIIK